MTNKELLSYIIEYKAAYHLLFLFSDSRSLERYYIDKVNQLHELILNLELENKEVGYIQQNVHLRHLIQRLY